MNNYIITYFTGEPSEGDYDTENATVEAWSEEQAVSKLIELNGRQFCPPISTIEIVRNEIERQNTMIKQLYTTTGHGEYTEIEAIDALGQLYIITLKDTAQSYPGHDWNECCAEEDIERREAIGPKGLARAIEKTKGRPWDFVGCIDDVQKAAWEVWAVVAED